MTKGLTSKRSLIFLVISILVLATLVAGFILPIRYFAHAPGDVELEGPWEVCFPKDFSETSVCQWKTVRVPSDLKKVFGDLYRGRALYRRNFATPVACLTRGACSILFAEIGDAAEVSLNGEVLGRRGGFSPDPFYARLYPMIFDIPLHLFGGTNDNLLTVRTESLKLKQSGIRNGPVSIQSPVNSRELSSHAGFSDPAAFLTLAYRASECRLLPI